MVRVNDASRLVAESQIDFDGKKGEGAYPAQIVSDDIDDMLQSSYGDVVRARMRQSTSS